MLINWRQPEGRGGGEGKAFEASLSFFVSHLFPVASSWRTHPVGANEEEEENALTFAERFLSA